MGKQQGAALMRERGVLDLESKVGETSACPQQGLRRAALSKNGEMAR